MGINNDSKAKKVMLEEFIKGKDYDSNKTLQRSKVDEDILDRIQQKVREYYGWDGKTSFAEIGGQNCSDMLVRVGERLFYRFAI